MGYNEDERRWKQMMDVLTAESNGKEPRPFASQRTLFGIPSSTEQHIAAIVAADEEAHRQRRREEAESAPAECASGPGVADGKDGGQACKAATGSATGSGGNGGQASRAGAGHAPSHNGESRKALSLEHVAHPLDPIFDSRSRILMLGTMPSPASREAGFYYGHPQNRFWRVLAALFNEPVADTNERRRDQLLRHHIALWDVLASCSIHGASDASIADAVPNRFDRILDAAPIEAVFCTGAKSAELYAKLCADSCGLAAEKLPSTSAANAAMGLPALASAYRAILGHLHPWTPPTLSVAETVALEQRIAEAGTPLAELMERAGRACAHRAMELLGRVRDARGGGGPWEEATREARDLDRSLGHPAVAILCGSGNNGGDGWVAARELALRGCRVTVISPKEAAELTAEPARSAAMAALDPLQKGKAAIAIAPDEKCLNALLAKADLIIDALLGTGFSSRTLRAPYGQWIEAANKWHRLGTPVLAVDVPSGLCAQSGQTADACIEADVTATMMVPKPGLALATATPFVGTATVEPLAYIEPLLG